MDRNLDTVTLGEIYRKQIELAKTLEMLSLEVRDRHRVLRTEMNDKIEELSKVLTEHIGPVAVIEHRVDENEDQLKAQAAKIEAMTAITAKISGGAAVLAVIGSLLFNAITWFRGGH